MGDALLARDLSRRRDRLSGWRQRLARRADCRGAGVARHRRGFANRPADDDTTIGVFFAGAFAFGIALISAQRPTPAIWPSFLLGRFSAFRARSLSDRRRRRDRARHDRPSSARADASSRSTAPSPTSTGSTLALRSDLSGPAFARDRGLAANRRQYPGAGDAGHSGGHRAAAYRSAPRHARALGRHRRAVRRRRLYASYHCQIASGASVVLVATALSDWSFSSRRNQASSPPRLRRPHFPHPERDRFATPGSSPRSNIGE